MDDKKFAIIIHKTNDDACNRLIDSLQNVDVPEGYDAEILPVEGDEKFFVYDFAMNQSDAKYKLYLDENVIVQEKNILANLLEIFQSDEKIGIIGVSGAVELSAHGLCWGSIKRCGKFFFDNDKSLVEESNFDVAAQDVDAIDGFFMATQYDLNWRYDLFHENTFGDTAQCIEFRRQGGGVQDSCCLSENGVDMVRDKYFSIRRRKPTNFSR